MYIFTLASWLLLIALFFQTANANSLEDDWKAFQQAENQAFDDFRSEHDKAFTQFLEQHWEEFDLYQGKTRDVTPKPPKAPAVKNWITSRYDKIEEPILTNKAITSNNKRSNLFFGHSINRIKFPDFDFPDALIPVGVSLFVEIIQQSLGQSA